MKTFPVHRRIRSDSLACVAILSVSFTGGAWAQSPDEIEAQLQESLKNVQELLENVPTLQQIEADEAALRELLNDTQDDLQAERARRAALEAQLQRLTGEAGPDTPPAGTEPPGAAVMAESSRWLTLPARRINALGMLDTAAQPIGVVPTGTESLVPRWPAHVSLPDGVAWPGVEIDGLRTRVVQGDTLGGRRVLGEFELRGTQAFWAWRGGADTASTANDAWLEALLRRTPLEAQRAGVALASFQIAPREMGLPEALPPQGSLSLRTAEHLGIDPTMAGVILVVERDGIDARRLEADDRQAGWIGRSTSTWVRLTDDGATLNVRQSSGLDTRLANLDRQRRAWQRDLRRADSRNDPVVQQARAELDRLDQETERLRALREGFDADARTRGVENGLTPAAAAAPVIRLVDPVTGVVLLRLTLAPAAPNL
ncbi:MAG: hypothetical protein AAGE65_08910 [Planctomycetota bacterium]